VEMEHDSLLIAQEMNLNVMTKCHFRG
jgi:hypothetical protein